MSDSIASPAAAPHRLAAEAGSGATEPGSGAAEAGAPPGGVDAIDDRAVRAVGIPTFGLVIPRATGLLDGVPVASVAYALGTAAFVALAAAIWQGNRWLLFEQRRNWGWFDHPVRKLVMLGAAIVLFTAPLTLSALAAWYAARGAPPDWSVIELVCVVNVLCVVVVTHVYETVFLIKERASDRLRLAELGRARAEAQLGAFLAQVDPHFLFNSLSALEHLIDADADRARTFTAQLSRLYRYLLRHRGRAVALLDDELAFLADYVALMKVRLGDALDVEVDAGAPRRHGRRAVPAAALQLLVENAVKHNVATAARPLRVRVVVGDDVVRVENVRQPRRSARASTGLGLANLDERSRLVAGRGIAVTEDAGRFVVDVPLVATRGAP